MPKGDKYLNLRRFLEKSSSPQISLSYEQIEQILQFKLPASAHKHSEAWWSNNRDHSQAIAWLDAGYETDYVTDTYEKKYIFFNKQTGGLR